MTTWRFILRLFLFNKWTLTLQVGTAIVSIVAIEHAVALAQREVFNTLTDDAGTSLGVWALCAILVALALGYPVTFLGDELLYRFNRFTLASLLRRNAFDHVLELRGNRSLPASPGEAVSRFRGDADQAVIYILDFDLLVANVLFFVVAIVITGPHQRGNGDRGVPAAGNDFSDHPCDAEPNTVVPAGSSRGGWRRDRFYRRDVRHGRNDQGFERGDPGYRRVQPDQQEEGIDVS